MEAMPCRVHGGWWRVHGLKPKVPTVSISPSGDMSICSPKKKPCPEHRGTLGLPVVYGRAFGSMGGLIECPQSQDVGLESGPAANLPAFSNFSASRADQPQLCAIRLQDLRRHADSGDNSADNIGGNSGVMAGCIPRPPPPSVLTRRLCRRSPSDSVRGSWTGRRRAVPATRSPRPPSACRRPRRRQSRWRWPR